MIMIFRSGFRLSLCMLSLFCMNVSNVSAQELKALHQDLDRLTQEVESRVIEWRRDFHQHPELSNREFRTAKIVAEHLKKLGMEVQTGIAHTGVVGILRGKPDGPVVALRADMDALPVTEDTNLPFASEDRGIYNNKTVGVMHACGHDAHMAILMGVAKVLSQVRGQLPGTVKFIFQPAEEGPPAGEEGGASLMIKEGVLENPAPSAIFGLHVGFDPWRMISYRARGMMASSDGLRILIRGRQTHGAIPWRGVDPIVVAAQVVMALQTIVSRQVPLTATPAVVTIGSIHGGNRGNIIPDEVELVGTIRTLDAKVRKDIHEHVRQIVTKIAESADATAEVKIETHGLPITYNDPTLTIQMTPTLQRIAGPDNFNANRNPLTGAEDFSFYQEEIPGLFFFLGTAPKDADPETVASPHSPRFYVEESALIVGVRALSNLAVDYLFLQSASKDSDLDSAMP
ncbi:MAG: amidohydrolase [Phycisphaerae bacterium]|nr:amidohydrolase [Phycisphaerae bacterium]